MYYPRTGYLSDDTFCLTLKFRCSLLTKVYLLLLLLLMLLKLMLLFGVLSAVLVLSGRSEGKATFAADDGASRGQGATRPRRRVSAGGHQGVAPGEEQRRGSGFEGELELCVYRRGTGVGDLPSVFVMNMG